MGLAAVWARSVGEFEYSHSQLFMSTMRYPLHEQLLEPSRNDFDFLSCGVDAGFVFASGHKFPLSECVL